MTNSGIQNNQAAALAKDEESRLDRFEKQPRYMQTQCWICPHCYDDSYHKSDANGCEWQYKGGAV